MQRVFERSGVHQTPYPTCELGSLPDVIWRQRPAGRRADRKYESRFRTTSEYGGDDESSSEQCGGGAGEWAGVFSGSLQFWFGVVLVACTFAVMRVTAARG
jgi:hypothetical protein